MNVKGLGRFRVRLNRAVPEGAVAREVVLTKHSGWDSPIEVRLVLAVPRAEPAFDPLKTGEAIHLAVRHLAPNASPMAYVEAVRAAGIPVRGDDAGVTHPSCDDTGAVTPHMKRPRREVAELLKLQRSLSWKDRCFAGKEA